MTDEEWAARFEADFGRLVRNRTQVSLEKLQTVYKKSYQALVDSLIEAADWLATRYLQNVTESWFKHPKDTEGNEWVERKVNAIIDEENRPGGLRDRWRAALIDDLDTGKYLQVVHERGERCEREAFDPYWQRHNRWRGEPGNRWIYNDIIHCYWLPPGKLAQCPDGAWIDNQYNVFTTNWPPAIGEDRGGRP